MELARIKNNEKINKILDTFLKAGGKTYKSILSYLPTSRMHLPSNLLLAYSSDWEIRHGYHWDKLGEEVDFKLSEALMKVWYPI